MATGPSSVSKLYGEAPQSLIDTQWDNSSKILTINTNDNKQLFTIIDMFYTGSNLSADIPTITVTTQDASVPDFSRTDTSKVDNSNYVTFRKITLVGTNTGYTCTFGSGSFSNVYIRIFTYQRS